MEFIIYTYVSFFIFYYHIKNYYIYLYVRRITTMLFVAVNFLRLPTVLSNASCLGGESRQWTTGLALLLPSNKCWCKTSLLPAARPLFLPRGNSAWGIPAFFLRCCPTDDCSRTNISGSPTDADTEDTTLASLKVSSKDFHYKMHMAVILTAAFSCCMLLLGAALIPPQLSRMHLVQFN